MKSEMTNGLDALPERVDRMEQKLDALSSSVDRRFDDVTLQFVEQRQYTEFAFDRLRKEMGDRFDLVATREQVERLDRKFDQQINGLDRKLDQQIDRLDRKLDQQIDRLDQQIDRLDQKLDQLIDGMPRRRATGGPKKR
jgi:hypothetical protein